MANYTYNDAVSQFKQRAVTPNGKLSDDVPFSNRAIVDFLNQARAKVLTDVMDMGRPMSEEHEQVLGCVKMKYVDMNECPCLPPSGCKWQRSEQPLPSWLKLRAVTGVTPNSRNPRFEYKKWDRIQYVADARLKSTREGRYYTLRDTNKGTYLYLYNDNFIDSISISGVWSDPAEAEAFPSCGEIKQQAKCNPLQISFHTDRRYVNDIIKVAVAEALQFRMNLQPDLINDDQVGNNPAGTQSGN